jgi:hypothetical protein
VIWSARDLKVRVGSGDGVDGCRHQSFNRHRT